MQRAATTAPGAGLPGHGEGLPAELRAGVERLSGFDMTEVRVHRNSNEPARLGASAFARGTDIHLGPQQDHHLPHEAWHVVQQMQGRVRQTATASRQPINDDSELESQADTMGARARDAGASAEPAITQRPPTRVAEPVVQGVFRSNGKDIPQPIIDKLRQAFIGRVPSETAFDEGHKSPTVHDLLTWLGEQKASGKVTSVVTAILRDAGLLPDDSSSDDDGSDSEPDSPEEILLGQIVRALNRGIFGVRWLKLNDKQQAEVTKRIEGLIPIFFRLRKGAEKDVMSEKAVDDFFVIHGSVIWGSASVSPSDIDVIDTGSSGQETKTVTTSGMRHKPKDDEVKISKMGSPLDTMIGIHFDQTTLAHVLPGHDWFTIVDQLRKLLNAAASELGSNKTVDKGTRKIINVCFVVDYFLAVSPEDHAKFYETFGTLMSKANSSLAAGNTPTFDTSLFSKLERFIDRCNAVMLIIQKSEKDFNSRPKRDEKAEQAPVHAIAHVSSMKEAADRSWNAGDIFELPSGQQFRVLKDHHGGMPFARGDICIRLRGG